MATQTLKRSFAGAAVRRGELFAKGRTIFVCSASGNDGNTIGDCHTPLATIAAALGYCQSGRGDSIVMLAGHTETIGASGLAIDVPGVEIVGLGRGSMRPTLTLADAAACIAVSAANVRLANLRLTASVAGVAKAVYVTAAGVELDGCDYFETASCPITQFLLTTSAADSLAVRNCRHAAATAAGSTQRWIQLVGVDDPDIVNCDFALTLNNSAASCTIGASTAIARGQISRNRIVQLGGTSQVSGILLADSSTALVADNRVAVGSTALAGICDVGNAGYACENYCLNTADKSGKLDPAADA